MPIRKMAVCGGELWAVKAALCAVIPWALIESLEIAPHKILS